jgi:regulator of replication initiation timing
MAQDFYAAFGVGEDDRHITSVDEDGVALAAIKALAVEDHGLHAENRNLRERLADDAARFTRDEALRARDELQRARDAARLLALERKVEALAAR